MNILGFGACMINGYPLDTNDSFFYKFINLLKSNNITVDSYETISLGGFPINRAEKYAIKKVVPENPDLVVIQFGSTDISLNFTVLFNKKFHKNVALSDNRLFDVEMKEEANKKILMKDITRLGYGKVLQRNFKFFIKYILSVILNFKQATPIDVYTKSMEHIIQTLQEHFIQIVVLSPFAQTDYFANRRAKKYLKALKFLNEKHHFLLVDCYTPLINYKNTNIFFDDGVHFSSAGHEIIANTLFNSYINAEESLVRS